MSLRLKVALWLVLIVLPATSLFTAYRVGIEKRSLQERKADRIANRLLERSPRRCDFRPDRRRRGMGRVNVYAYDDAFVPIRPDAPVYPETLRGAEPDEPLHTVMWRGPWSGATAIRTSNIRCPNIVLFWPNRGVPVAATKSIAAQTAVLFLVLLLTGLGISGPIVRRLRRLSVAVAAAPAQAYKIAVETEATDEIGDLARAFEASGAKVASTIADLEARDRALKAYIANTTHDLATPLTVLQHRIRKALELNSDAAVTLHLKTALEESHYMASLVKNLNVTAKLEAAAIVLETHPQDLADLVERIVRRHEPIALAKGVEVNVARPSEPLVVNCDSTLVEQAVSNLVQNAVQYTAEGGHVAVVLDTAQDGFELKIIDDGPGIEPEMIERVLERAVRAGDARTRNPAGRGLGMSIARDVLDLHNWSFELSNDGGLKIVIRGGL